MVKLRRLLLQLLFLLLQQLNQQLGARAAAKQPLDGRNFKPHFAQRANALCLRQLVDLPDELAELKGERVAEPQATPLG